jgi:phage portal protein BeeE
MAIYSPDGKLISNASPTPDEIEKGYSTFRSGTTVGDWPFYVPHPSSLSRLSFKMLRSVYELSSSVRPAVDSITRETAHLNWTVTHKDKKYHPPQEAENLVDFFKKVNHDNENVSVLLTKFINDLLVVGKGVIEKVRSPLGNIVELVACDSSLFQPVYKEGLGIIGYQEFKRDSYQKREQHAKEDVIFRYFTPVTYTTGSVPIIETIVNEVSLLMLSVKSIAWAFTHDEIPPGILHLGIVGQEAMDRAKASFEAAKGTFGKNQLRVIDNVDKVNWVQLQRPFREMQVAELMPIIERIVARNFGLAPVETGLSDVSHGTADVSVRSSQSKLIIPLITLIVNSLNEDVLREISSDYNFRFIDSPQDRLGEKVTSFVTLWRAGLATRNEVRAQIGMSPIEGGDIFTVLLGNEVVPLDDKTGLPPEKPQPAFNPLGGPLGGLPPPGFPQQQQPPPGLPPPANQDNQDNQQTAALNLSDADFMEIFDLDGADVKKNF